MAKYEKNSACIVDNLYPVRYLKYRNTSNLFPVDIFREKDARFCGQRGSS